MSLFTSIIKKDPEAALKKLNGALQKALGGRLKSIIVFGSFVRSGFDAKKSRIDVLVVADLSYESLEMMRPAIQNWMKKGHAVPVLVAPDDLDDFARDFPIEFVDMQSRHRVLMGPDVLTSLKVNKIHLESQVEHDLALLQLKLRQVLTSSGEKDLQVQRVFEKAVSSLHVIFSAAALLSEEKHAELDKMQAALRSASFTETLSVIEEVLTYLRKN